MPNFTHNNGVAPVHLPEPSCAGSHGTLVGMEPSHAQARRQKTIGLAKLIMQMNLPVRLRLLVGAVENSVSGNATRPMDVLPSRKGITVEIGNTDAEGRLVLADALWEAASETPDLLIDCATLTGAARVAVGTELPALFCNDEAMMREARMSGLAPNLLYSAGIVRAV